MQHTVNLAIQILPLHADQPEAYHIIDAAIAVVQASGYNYVVCPFETVVEGPYDKLMQLLADMQHACYDAGATALLVNMKLHTARDKDMAIADKTGKYAQ